MKWVPESKLPIDVMKGSMPVQSNIYFLKILAIKVAEHK